MLHFDNNVGAFQVHQSHEVVVVSETSGESDQSFDGGVGSLAFGAVRLVLNRVDDKPACPCL